MPPTHDDGPSFTLGVDIALLGRLLRSLHHRYPALVGLHHVQASLLARWRAGDHDELVQRGVHLTINGVATALRNSG